jgi:hypothetical protein
MDYEGNRLNPYESRHLGDASQLSRGMDDESKLTGEQQHQFRGESNLDDDEGRYNPRDGDEGEEEQLL